MEPAHRANTLFHEAFDPFFQDPLPPNLGSELFRTGLKQLHAQGLHNEEDGEEAFSTMMVNALDYLRRNGASTIQNPRAWFHAICRNAVRRYVAETLRQDALTFDMLLGGESSLLDTGLYSEERILKVIRKAIQGLPPRYREFILLDLEEALPPREIQERMEIKSYGYFRKLKHEAFSALRAAIKALVENGIESLFDN